MRNHRCVPILAIVLLLAACSGVNTSQLVCNTLRGTEQQAQQRNSTGYQPTAVEQSPSCADYQRLRQQENKP
jgi:uncharacterized lipoprotein YajG